MTFWFADFRGHGTVDVLVNFPPGVINRHTIALVSICEIAQPQGEPLDFPFQGAATMTVHNVVPRDDGKLGVRAGIDWDSDLNCRLQFGVET